MTKFRTLFVLTLSFTFNTLFAQHTTPKPFKLFFEKSYLHTDREQYTSGENIWFKVYLVNGQTNTLINTSNNLYVELISPGAEIISRNVIRINKGLGKGDFLLSDSIATGTYRIRAYTNWMRNFGDNFIFEKQIKIVNTDNPQVAKANDAANKEQGLSIKSVDKLKDADAAIQFFPEGGSMIEGIAGLLSFKAIATSGNGIAFKGQVLSSSGEEMNTITSPSNGMGSFMLFPLAGIKYRLKGNYANGKSFNTELPIPLIKGFAMHIKATDSLIYLNLSTNLATLQDFEGEELLIVGKSHGKTCYSAKIVMKDVQGAVTIPKNLFPAGIASISLTDDQGRPHCERLVYIEDPNPVTLVITADKAMYKYRERVTLKLNASHQNGQPVSGNFSMAAVDAGLITANKSSVASYLMLESELKGHIENPDQYFDKGNAQRTAQLDLLLMTQGWRDFTWKRLADSALRVTYEVEQGITVSGNVKQLSSDKSMAGMNISLSAFKAKGAKLFSAVTDSAGKFYIDTVQLYGAQPLTLTSVNSKGKQTGLLVMDSLFKKPIELSLRPISVMDSAMLSLSNRLVHAKQNQMKQSMSDTINLKEVVVKSKRRQIQLTDRIITDFGYKDESFTITSKDYDYRNLGHFILHRVSTARPDDTDVVSFLSTNGSTPASTRFIVNNKEVLFREDDPAEMKTHYKNLYYNISMDKVQDVLVKHLLGTTGLEQTSEESTNAFGVATESMSSLMGPKDFYIIYLTLKPGALARTNPSTLKEDVSGYYESRTYYSPKYSLDPEKQDLRPTVYWNPNIVTDATGSASVSFQNGVQKTQLRVIVEGLTVDGIPVASKVVLNIK
ncbi:hypothetical protein [Arcticibacter eurypsychrophilus]|uniref:hypothetical protein n=1 Tax=Arcticibacter eurypsychrophilus TaxID=1434752 RepID=UPI00084D0C68|nr:hypothetical protein [Arcticibacter eurypsychrophilus]